MDWIQQLGSAKYFGSPWHGYMVGNKLTLDTGRTITVPESAAVRDSRTYLLRLPGLPVPETPPAQAALGMEWRNYALIGGGHLHGANIGSPRWIYIDGAGKPWVMRVDLGYTQTQVLIDVTVERPYSHFDPAGPPMTGTALPQIVLDKTPYVDTRMAPGFETGLFTWNIGDVQDNGGALLLLLWMPRNSDSTGFYHPHGTLRGVLEVRLAGTGNRSGGTIGAGITASAVSLRNRLQCAPGTGAAGRTLSDPPIPVPQGGCSQSCVTTPMPGWSYADTAFEDFDPWTIGAWYKPDGTPEYLTVEMHSSFDETRTYSGATAICDWPNWVPNGYTVTGHVSVSSMLVFRVGGRAISVGTAREIDWTLNVTLQFTVCNVAGVGSGTQTIVSTASSGHTAVQTFTYPGSDQPVGWPNDLSRYQQGGMPGNENILPAWGGGLGPLAADYSNGTLRQGSNRLFGWFGWSPIDPIPPHTNAIVPGKWAASPLISPTGVHLPWRFGTLDLSTSWTLPIGPQITAILGSPPWQASYQPVTGQVIADMTQAVAWV